MDKLKQAQETYGFTNVWTNEWKILFKSDSNAEPQVYYSQFFYYFHSAKYYLDGKVLVMILLEICFICWRIYESVLFIVSLFIVLVLCFLRFHGNASLKYCFDFLYFLYHYFSLYYLFVEKKNIYNFDKSKSFLINSTSIVLLVINHIESLPLNNHLFDKRDIIKVFDIT